MEGVLNARGTLPGALSLFGLDVRRRIKGAAA
jgi:hypothetical protein